MYVVTIRFMKMEVSYKQYFFPLNVYNLHPPLRIQTYTSSSFIFLMSWIILIHAVSSLVILLIVLWPSVFSQRITTLSISWNGALLVVYSLSFCKTGNIFISSLYLKDNFAGYIILGWWFFSFSNIIFGSTLSYLVGFLLRSPIII